jgi:hypothetical protein
MTGDFGLDLSNWNLLVHGTHGLPWQDGVGVRLEQVLNGYVIGLEAVTRLYIVSPLPKVMSDELWLKVTLAF